MQCKYCKCTDDRACGNICYWIYQNVCSNCRKPYLGEINAKIRRLSSKIDLLNAELDKIPFEKFLDRTKLGFKIRRYRKLLSKLEDKKKFLSTTKP
jgi:hypothetical protein